MATDLKSRSIRATLAPLVLATWGGVMLDVVATGKIQTLLHPAFHPWVALTGGLLAVIAIALLFAPGALHPEPLRVWLGRGGLLLIPLLISLYVAPSTFSAYTVLNRGVNASLPPSSQASTANSSTSGAGDQPMITDIPGVMAFTDSDQQRLAADGKNVQLVGQYYPVKDGEFEIVRLYMYCCAADASPISINVQGDLGSQKQEEWIQVTGTVRFRKRLGQWEPYLVSPSVLKTNAPADPYVY
jgi:uncharacterized repeat protein (TIGR03943 family)